jgi:hypothetical protein
MSSVFEAGLAIACIVIIHNWFKESVLGTFSAIWFTGSYLQMITQTEIFLAQPDAPNITKSTGAQTLTMQSYLLAGGYLLLSVVCYFFFYHHPSHIGIKIRKTK